MGWLGGRGSAKPGDLSLIPSSHTVDRENCLLQVVLCPPHTQRSTHTAQHSCAHPQTPTSTNTHPHKHPSHTQSKRLSDLRMNILQETNVVQLSPRGGEGWRRRDAGKWKQTESTLCYQVETEAVV